MKFIILRFVICVAASFANPHVIPGNDKLTSYPGQTNGSDNSKLQENDNLQLKDSKLQRNLGNREKRWAIPADVQDSPCPPNQVRRLDGVCMYAALEDDYENKDT